MPNNPIPRFVKVGAEKANDIDQFPIVRDARTGLMWDRREFASMTMEQAQSHIATLNEESFGGFNDWRLPECDELLSLVDRTKYLPAIDKEAFPLCKNSWYRSATPYAGSPGDCAWGVSFYDGSSNWSYHDDDGFVRAVRVGQ